MDDPGNRAGPAERRRVCALISISCTTAWTDWVHGDLWLCPDGLLRRSRGWQKTMANVDKQGVIHVVDPANRPIQELTDNDLRRFAAEDTRNWWITWDQISTAKLQSGPLSHALHVQLRDGRKVSLRWLRQDGPTDFLAGVIAPVLGDRLTVS